MILGHNHPEICNAVIEAAKKGLSFGAATELEVQMADLITSIVPSIEMVRMVNSGTEAKSCSAIGAARVVIPKKIRLSSSQDVTTVIQMPCWLKSRSGCDDSRNS